MTTFIIAEAGVNHNGDFDTAIKLVNAAIYAGADAVKFQTFKSEKLVSSTTPKAKYQIENMKAEGSHLEMLRQLELSNENWVDLFAYCEKKKIMILSTPFDEESTDVLNSLGMKIFKIPSGEITNKPLIQHIASKNKPIILSTGMSYLGEVEKAIGWIYGGWNKFNMRQQLTLLHCISSYPTPFEEVNLSAIKTMEHAFGLHVGFSDHTTGIEITLAAVAIGAKIIEKHFTLDRNMEGPDHKVSLEPNELKEMIKSIRNIERAKGDGIKAPAESEKATRNVVRRSLVAAKSIKNGQTITADIISIKRPGTGISPEYNEVVIGMTACKDINADSVIRWEDLKHA